MTISQERLREIASIPDEEIDTRDISELGAGSGKTRRCASKTN